LPSIKTKGGKDIEKENKRRKKQGRAEKELINE
jgi:hypothetical protein